MGIFNWNRQKTEDTAKTKRRSRRPGHRDFTEGYVANEALTKGLYRNTYPGMKLGAGLVYPMIKIPVYFMGLPTPVSKSGNEAIGEMLQTIIDQFSTLMENIHIQSHREGTIWIHPRWDRNSRSLKWEFIPDSVVTDIVTDISTGEAIRIYTDEQITITTGFNKDQIIRRQRIFTKKRIEVRYYGQGAGIELENRIMRNPTGMLPIAFSNDADGDEIRGHSDIERVTPIIKMYHDISLAEAEDIATFRTTMLQDIGDGNVNEWLENNGYTEDDFANGNFDISNVDLIFNRGKKGEETEFIFSDRITQGPEAVLKRLFRFLVETTGLPEIVWGVKTEGNANTAEEQMTTLLQYVSAKRRMKNEPYLRLFTASLMLMSMVQGANIDIEDINITWNSLNNVSDKTKSEIFRNFATGIESVMNVAGLSKRQLYNLWKMQYPNETEETFEEFITAISDMASFKQFSSASYLDALDAGGQQGVEG